MLYSLGPNTTAADNQKEEKENPMKSALPLRIWLKFTHIENTQTPLTQTWSHGCIYMQWTLGNVVCPWANMYVHR